MKIAFIGAVGFHEKAVNKPAAGKHMTGWFRKIISVLLIAAVLTGPLTLVSDCAGETREICFIKFGSYPQSRVRDEKLVSELNRIKTEPVSYGYYSGTGVYDDGKMTSSDYMRYSDVCYNGSRYRGVVFDRYRPAFTGCLTTDADGTYQDDNGYECGKTYWFKYEPLEWRVIDPETGYVICESIIDSQPFSNFIYFNGSAYYMDKLSYDFSNYYVNSSLRKWLNSDFAGTAFSPEEKDKITVNYMDDLWLDIYDRVFLPSADEMKNTAYWKDDASKIACGTDYAKCQGLFETGGRSYWRLRSQSDWSHAACGISTDGTAYGYNYYYNVYPYFTCFTGTGVRPAVKLGRLSGTSFKIYKRAAAVPVVDMQVKMSFFGKAAALFNGLGSIVRYYLTPVKKDNESALGVMDSLGRGINVPCMESGWPREIVLEKETFSNIKNGGFDYIRLPANLACMLDDNGTLNEIAAGNLDKVLNYALETGLNVILDLHGWEELNKNPAAENIETLVSVWKQIAVRYKDYPDGLMFEIMNEPHNDSGKMKKSKWNYVQNKAVAAIREIDSDRIVVLSTRNWNAVSTLTELMYRKKDPYIVIDVHNYEPMKFTHQGAEWLDCFEEKVPYTAQAGKEFADAIETAVKFRNKYGTKIIVGEFGAYLKQTEKRDVTAFLSDAVTVMEKNNLPWAYWEYCAGFGAYDTGNRQWKPFVMDALMP